MMFVQATFECDRCRVQVVHLTRFTVELEKKWDATYGEQDGYDAHLNPTDLPEG